LSVIKKNLITTVPMINILRHGRCNNISMCMSELSTKTYIISLVSNQLVTTRNLHKFGILQHCYGNLYRSPSIWCADELYTSFRRIVYRCAKWDTKTADADYNIDHLNYYNNIIIITSSRNSIASDRRNTVVTYPCRARRPPAHSAGE